jgi:putative membrane protein
VIKLVHSLIGAELKAILTNRKVLIPIVAVLFIPVLYAGMFLWAFWDPYKHIDNLPVAVVNNDEGAEFEGEPLHLGDKLVEELKSSKDFHFQFVDEEEAYRDLKNQKYYMVVEIPHDFSQNATTLLDENPKKLQLKYVPNESYNFLSAQIGETAMKEIRAEMQKKITKTYSEAIFDQVKEMAEGLQKASDGAKELNDGALKLLDGSNELKSHLETLALSSIEFKEGVSKADEGSEQLASGMKELSSGLGQLKDGHSQLLQGTVDLQSGTNQLADGIGQVYKGLTTVETKMNQLMSGMNKAATGAQQFSQSMPELQQQTGKLATGAEQVADGIKELQAKLLAQQSDMEQLAATLQQLLPPEQFAQIAAKLPSAEESEQLAESLEQLKNGSVQVALGTATLNQTIEQTVAPNVQQLSDGLAQLSAGQKQLNDGVHELVIGSKDLNNGVKKIQAGQHELVSGNQLFHQKITDAYNGSKQLVSGGQSLTEGLNVLLEGSEKLSDGAEQLADGSKEFTEGTLELQNGTDEMYKKLAKAADQANGVDVEDQNLDMMAEPVQVQHEGIHKVPNYGTGFAPYFMSLGLFVGALLMTIVFPFKEPMKMPKNSLEWFFSKFIMLACFGTIQALIVDFVLLFGLGLEVQNVSLFIMTSIITSLTFMALVQMLVSILDQPGRFLAIIILILQLTTSAGTFPLELIPSALQKFNALLPMTYSIFALKAAISSGENAFMWQNNMILLAFATGCALMTIAYFTFQFKRTGAYEAEN